MLWNKFLLEVKMINEGAGFRVRVPDSPLWGGGWRPRWRLGGMGIEDSAFCRLHD